MRNLTRWSPIGDLMSLHNGMDRLFGESFGFTSPTAVGPARSVAAVGEGYLPLDVYQTEKEWVIRAAVPGVDPQAVDVTWEGATITIKGEIPAPESAHPENFWIRENFWGKFSRQVTLPEDSAGDQTRAQFHNGMLVITVPKAQASRTKGVKIPVTAGAGQGQLETAGKK